MVKAVSLQRGESRRGKEGDAVEGAKLDLESLCIIGPVVDWVGFVSSRQHAAVSTLMS